MELPKDITEISCACEAVFRSTKNAMNAKNTLLESATLNLFQNRVFAAIPHFKYFPSRCVSLFHTLTHLYFILRKHHAIRILNKSDFQKRNSFTAAKTIIFRGE